MLLHNNSGGVTASHVLMQLTRNLRQKMVLKCGVLRPAGSAAREWSTGSAVVDVSDLPIQRRLGLPAKERLARSDILDTAFGRPDHAEPNIMSRRLGVSRQKAWRIAPTDVPRENVRFEVLPFRQDQP
jgi:hypothetical protein